MTEVNEYKDYDSELYDTIGDIMCPACSGTGLNV